MSDPSGGTRENRDKNPAADADVVSLRPSRPCPICGKPSVREFYPFNSKRCADLDLHRWLSGAYAIAAEEVEIPSEEESPEDRIGD